MADKVTNLQYEIPAELINKLVPLNATLTPTEDRVVLEAVCQVTGSAKILPAVEEVLLSHYTDLVGGWKETNGGCTIVARIIGF